MIFITLRVFHQKYFIIEIWFLLVITVYNELKCIGYSSVLIQRMASIFHLKGVKVSAHRLFNLFCSEVLTITGNSTVCSSDCHCSENTKLNRKVAWTLCSPIEFKHLCPVSDICDPSCSRQMYLNVWFPALCNLVYKYWIAAKFQLKKALPRICLKE